MTGSESVDNSFILSASFIFFPWPGNWCDFFEFVILFILLCVPFLMYDIIIWKQILIGACYNFFLPSWCLLGFFVCDFLSWNTCVPRYPAELHFFFSNFYRFAMVCFSFPTFGLLGCRVPRGEGRSGRSPPSPPPPPFGVKKYKQI